MAEGGAGGDDDEEKPHEPSQKKLADARRQGDVARSTDLSTALAYGGLVLALAFHGPVALDRIGVLGAALLELPAGALRAGTGGTLRGPSDASLLLLIGALAPLVLLPAALVLAAAIAQGQMVPAWSKLEPKLSRLSLVENAKQKFGLKGLFEFLKSLTKLLVVSAVLIVFGIVHAEEVGAAMTLSPRQGIAMMLRLSLEFLMAMVVVSLGIAAIDYLFQLADWRRRHRMSHREVRDEMKETEGDPHMKAQRRRKGRDLVGKSLVQAVESADVVIVNPEHFAVALKWDRARDRAPVCVARGQDEIALRMREIAREAGVPIHADPPTARALFAALQVGDEVPFGLYRPVAAAIRFAETLRRRRAARGL